MILSCEMLTLNESCKVAHVLCEGNFGEVHTCCEMLFMLILTCSMWNGPRVLCEGNFGEVRTCCEMLFMLLTFNM